MASRAAFYVDGFNAYHALHGLGQPHLKWLNWWALAQLLIPSKSETLAKVVFCTAIRNDDPAKQARHRKYIRALQHAGVECLTGHFADEHRQCRSCNATWKAPIEKQGDVNLAISVVDDAHGKVFEHCYLVTADGDQVATAKLLKRKFPDLRLTTVVIQGKEPNFKIRELSDASITIKEKHIERCLFAKLITGQDAIIRPPEYDPPPGWVEPRDRPGK